MKLSEAQWDALSPNEQLHQLLAWALEDVPGAADRLEEMLALKRENPLQFFDPHPAKDGRRPQLEFIEALTKIVAALAGNQFGKSTILTVCGLREALPREFLPDLLLRTKRYEGPTDGWILCPTEDKIYDSFQPAFEEWCPPSAFKGGSWGKAFNGARMQLSFEYGSTITFKTYKQDPSTLGGARLHWVGYDEPPPRKHREECRMRLVRYGGHEMFAMTPIETNTGYIKQEIWKKREAPHITLVRGSIHDNPTLDAATVALTLGDGSDIFRAAREYGEFVNAGGMVYPDFERSVLPKDHRLIVARDGRFTFDSEFIRGLDIVCGIDPGMRNCGLVWVGFDGELVAHVFDEALLQDKGAKEYAAQIRETNSRWGLKDVSYVVDPAAKQRAQANGMTVLAALNQEQIYPNLGQNDHELGFGQLRARMMHKRFVVGPNCVGLRDEADDYVGKTPEEGQDDSHLDPVKGNDHRLDALRYAVLERFWDPVMEQDAPQRNLGFDPGVAMPVERLRVPQESHPMGMMF